MAQFDMNAIWAYFKPLWSDLRKEVPPILLAGGYGLFLKQKWLLSSEPKPRLLVSLDQWITSTHRVTGDYDIIVDLNLIASKERQSRIHEILENNRFDPDVKSGIKMLWKHRKKKPEAPVSIDWHTQFPSEGRKDLEIRLYEVENYGERKTYRVVRASPSLNPECIDAIADAETVGCERYPFEFEIDGVQIAVPNPVTWAVMKLAATQDHRYQYDHPQKENMERNQKFHEEQWRKHAQDVCRVVAMTTRDEYDNAGDIVEDLQGSAVFQRAVKIQHDLFQAEEGWGRRIALAQWQDDDARAILAALSGWFEMR